MLIAPSCVLTHTATLEPNLLATLSEFIAKLRWDEQLGLPLNKVIL